MSSGYKTVQVISLGYISALYPPLLCITTYCLIELHAKDVRFVVKLWKPFHRCICYVTTDKITIATPVPLYR